MTAPGVVIPLYEETMKIALALCALAGVISLALAAPASAQTRDDIMNRVIWPCVDHEVQELDLEERHSESAVLNVFGPGKW